MLGRGMARFNRQVLNRLTRPLARHLPGFGVIIHRGRKTDRLYKTPVNVFRHDGDYIVALTYGPQSDWVKNVLAAGGCKLTTRGCCIPLVAPHIEHDESRCLVPAVVQPMLRLLRVADFLHLGSYRPT
jgi:deazaflavin-dependent oxidoreductase (nitroreductase family)